jgi:hypothetical protein
MDGIERHAQPLLRPLSGQRRRVTVRGVWLATTRLFAKKGHPGSALYLAAKEIAHQAGDLGAVFLQGEVAGIEQGLQLGCVGFALVVQ